MARRGQHRVTWEITWNELNKLNAGDAKVKAALKDLKDLHRNPLIHPEQTLENVDDAIALMNGVHTAVLSAEGNANHRDRSAPAAGGKYSTTTITECSTRLSDTYSIRTRARDPAGRDIRAAARGHVRATRPSPSTCPARRRSPRASGGNGRAMAMMVDREHRTSPPTCSRRAFLQRKAWIEIRTPPASSR